MISGDQKDIDMFVEKFPMDLTIDRASALMGWIEACKYKGEENAKKRICCKNGKSETETK